MGVRTTQLVTVTITGSNDAPVLSADAVATHPLSEVSGVTNGSATNAAPARSASPTRTSPTAIASRSGPDHDLVGRFEGPCGHSQRSVRRAQGDLDRLQTDGSGSVALNFGVADKLVDFLSAGET